MTKSTKRLYALATAILFYSALNTSIKYDTELNEDNRVLSDEHYLLVDNQFSYIPEENKQLKRKR